tara:strand:- start:6183 stop:9167 length:2985 start_codon:yes stop_codon:yes gene_type:complete
MEIYLPTKLNPQGWLSDVLLSQLYNDVSSDVDLGRLHTALYNKDYAGIKKKIISLHPSYRNKLLPSLQKVSNNAGKNPTSVPIDERYVKFMRDLKPHHVAAMQPYIQIFLKTKKNRNKKGSWADADTKAIVFRPFADIGQLAAQNKEGVLKNKFMRGEGAGIENMSVKRDFPVWGLGASFEVDISFFFSSFQIFSAGHPVQEPKSGATDGNSLKADDYLKLITPDLDNEIETLNLEYGWKINNKGDSSFWGVSKDVLQLVENEEKKSFRINWNKHDITFSETGEVQIRVKYYGLPENQAYTTPKKKKESNILKPLNFDMLKAVTSEENLTETLKSLESAKKEVKKLTDLCLNKFDKDGKPRDPKEIADLKAKIPGRKEEIRRQSIAIEKMKRDLAHKASSLFLKRIKQNNKLFQVRFRSYRKDGETAFDGKGKHTIEAHFFRVDPDTKLVGNSSIEKAKDYVKKGAIAKFKSTYSVQKSLSKSLEKLTWHKTAATAKEKTRKQLDKILGALTYSNFGAGEFKTTEKIIDSKDLPCPSGMKTAIKQDASLPAGKLKCVPKTVPQKGESRPEYRFYGNFMFFPLRDLISVMHEFSNTGNKEDNPYDRYPIVSLGNIIYRPMGKDVTVNIGDILIEVGVFQRWFYNSVVAKEAKNWTFGQFIQSVMEELVPAALGSFSLANSSGPTSAIVHSPFQISEKYFRASKKGKSGKHPADEIYFMPEAGSLGSADNFNRYLAELKSNSELKNDRSVIHFHQRFTPQIADTGFNTPMLKRVHGRKFDREKDEVDGLFHLFIGNSTGLLETISFSYTDNPDLRTALVFDKFKDIAFPYLKFAYSANSTLTGNNLFYKGGFFVLPVSPLGIPVEQDPGITGYYWIQNLVDQFSMGTYKTVVNGINAYSPALFAKEQKFRKKEEQCGIKEIKERAPKEIPIAITYGIDEYIHKDFILDPKIVKMYKLRPKTKAEKDTAPEPPATTADPSTNVLAGPDSGIAGQPMM